MIRLFIIISIHTLFSLLALNAQNSDWMINPVQHKIGLSGTFGELRTNHFHAGIDIKSSNGRIGDPIVAIADGYISRVQISKTGYGNALYISHPNNRTSVYGHLDSFEPPFSTFIESIQYQKKSFEIDTIFEIDSMLFVQQGQQIGSMGNTGNSFGPHLHFEIRNTETEVLYNPLRHGIQLTDRTKPHFKRIRIHHLAADTSEITAKNYDIKKISSGKYTIDNGRVDIPAWRAGFSSLVHDLYDGISNQNGIYSLRFLVDDTLRFSIQFDSLAFTGLHYCNAHTDYKHAVEDRKKVHRCFKLPGNQLENIQESKGAIVKLYKNKGRSIEIQVADFYGNTSIVQFDAYRSDVEPDARVFEPCYLIPWANKAILDDKNYILSLEEETFYSDICLSVLELEDSDPSQYSNTIKIGERTTPIAKKYILGLPIHSLDSIDVGKLCIISCDKNKAGETFGGEFINNQYVTAYLNRLGSFSVGIDTIKPTINVVSFPYQVHQGSKIAFKITDNYIPRSLAQDLRYEVLINGKWVLFDFDLKTETISYKVDSKIKPGKNKLELKVIDDRGNVGTFVKEFIRK